MISICRLIIIFIFSLAYIACEPPDKSSYVEGIGLRVKVPMGKVDESTGQEIRKLPYIANKAIIPNLGDETLEFLILTEALDKNDFIQTKFIGVMNIRVGGILKNIVIAIPSDKEIQTVGINNFIEFVSEYYFLKQNIENWYLNKNGLGSAELVSWEDEKYALNLVNRKLRSKR